MSLTSIESNSWLLLFNKDRDKVLFKKPITFHVKKKIYETECTACVAKTDSFV